MGRLTEQALATLEGLREQPDDLVDHDSRLIDLDVVAGVVDRHHMRVDRKFGP